MMADLSKFIARMKSEMVEISRRQRNMMRTGRVVEIDAAKGRVRVDIGDERNPLVSAWIQWPERAGARKTWNPPSVGEVMTVMSPSGEIDERSWAVHGGFSAGNAAPSSEAGDAVFTVGSTRITVKGDTTTVVVGGSTVDITDGAISLSTSQIAFTADSMSMDLGGGGVGISVNGSEIAFTGGSITHNGKDIGDTHKHDGIMPGGANTGAPI